MTEQKKTAEERAAELKRRRTEGTMQQYLEGKARKPPLFQPDDRTTPYDEEDPRHGTLGAYTMGCRCGWCTQAGKAYREYRKLGLKLPKDYNAKFPETHG